MTAQLHYLDDYRPPPIGAADLYFNAWLRIVQGFVLLAAIPLAIYIRGRR